MENRPLISIIVPTYNRSQLLLETLDSISNQTYQNWECIVVDDGSTDKTLNVLAVYCKKDSRFQYYKRPADRHKGANACRNYGFENSSGKFIIFLDDDDLLHSEALTKRVAAIRADSSTDVAVFSTQVFNKTAGDSIRMLNKDIANPDRYVYLCSFLSGKLCWSTTSPIWKRSFLNGELFDEHLKRFQDVEFHIRQLLREEINIKRVDDVDNFYRINDKIKSGGDNFKVKVGLSFILIFKKIIPKVEPDINLVRAIKRFVYLVFINYVSSSKNLKLNHEFRETILKHGIFTKKERILFKIQGIITKNALLKYRGVGVYKIEQAIKMYFSY